MSEASAWFGLATVAVMALYRIGNGLRAIADELRNGGVRAAQMLLGHREQSTTELVYIRTKGKSVKPLR